uniref:Gamma-soluble NSF attachment protein n=1 Tax=Oryctolagus cuniculus TaxID=9986 RepID=A0A5F9DTF9_RABIT
MCTESILILVLTPFCTLSWASPPSSSPVLPIRICHFHCPVSVYCLLCLLHFYSVSRAWIPLREAPAECRAHPLCTHESISKSTQVLHSAQLRAGMLIENVDPEKAVQLYQQTANVFENEERLRQAVELLGKASRLLVRGRRFDEAAISIQKEKNIYKEIENYPTCYKKTIAQVLVHLHRNDYVAAERCVRESYSIPGFNGSEDCAALEQLLEGYDQQDQDQVSEVCNSPLFKYMDNDYAKLGLSLVVPGGGIKKKSPATPQAKPDGVSAAAAEEEEDEYSGGLC